MNPWQYLRSEIGGALRSLKYDLEQKRARQRMSSDTMELPVIRPGKRRIMLATGAVLLPAAAFSGYLAVTSGLNALLAENGAPAGLPPYTGAQAPAPEPLPSLEPLIPVTGQPTRPGVIKSTYPTPEATLSGSPPVPTPAPTPTCSHSPSPSPTPSATVSPSAAPTPTPAPTSSATP